MQDIQIGELIGIPCQVNEGAFEGEVLVEFETVDGRVSGFTGSENVETIGEIPHIKGKIVAINGDRIEVMVEGSFFSTNGLANVMKNEVAQLAA